MKKAITIIILSIIVIGGGLVYWNYYNRYSDGFSEGVLYSFQRKGNVFKTYEGTVIQPGLRSARQGGLNTNEFYFSVEDQAVADSLEKVIGKTVRLHFNQYRKSLPWRGENYNTDNKDNGQFMVDRIEQVSETNPAMYNSY